MPVDRNEIVAGQSVRRILEFLRKQRRADFSSWPVMMFFSISEKKAAALVEALIAKGWVEQADGAFGRKSKTYFRASAAGQRLCGTSRSPETPAEFAEQLLLRQANRTRMKPAMRHIDGSLACLCHLHRELAKASRDPDDSRFQQREMLSSLEGGLNESAIGSMYEWWHYDLETLARGRALSPPRKPKIDLSVLLNSKGNLSVEWEPAGLALGSPAPGCDWLHWRRDVVAYQRPSNELLFVREAGPVIHHISLDRFHRDYTADDRVIETILLQALSMMLQELKHRLARSFAVDMVSDLFMEWEQVPTKSKGTRRTEDRLVSCVVESVSGRARREALHALEGFEGECGLSLEQFAKAVQEARTKRRTGPPPLPSSTDERISKALKKAGYAKMTAGRVGRYRAMLERYRRDLLPTPPGPTVVPFRRPNGEVGS